MMAKASKNKQKGFKKNIKKNRKESFNGTPTFITNYAIVTRFKSLIHKSFFGLLSKP